MILACGNTLRGDDGVGPAAADALRSQLGERAEVIACHQFTPELIEPISEAALVVFIDATVEGTHAGQVHEQVLDLQEQQPATAAAWTHKTDPLRLLALTEAVYGKRPRQAVVISVTAGDFSFGAGLSAPVGTALGDVVARACAWVGRG